MPCRRFFCFLFVFLIFLLHPSEYHVISVVTIIQGPVHAADSRCRCACLLCDHGRAMELLVETDFPEELVVNTQKERLFKFINKYL